MSSNATGQVTAGLLLFSLVSLLALTILTAFLMLIFIRRRRASDLGLAAREKAESPYGPRYWPTVFEQACRWVAIKSSRVAVVQSALGLNNPVPCSWGEGLARLTSHKLFISPPIRGWILVIGQGLPDPSEDVDECFHFLTKLSRATGQLQFFSVNRALNQHAWVRADGGHIRRAYAWAGETIWNQGETTRAEIEVGLKCAGYGEGAVGDVGVGQPDPAVSNTEKVMLLAAKWSFDPTALHQGALETRLGIAGDVIHSKPH
jgi:hypothetical protein